MTDQTRSPSSILHQYDRERTQTNMLVERFFLRIVPIAFRVCSLFEAVTLWFELQAPFMSGDSPNTSLNVSSTRAYFETIGKAGRAPRDEGLKEESESPPGNVRAKVAHYIALQHKHAGKNHQTIDDDEDDEDGVSSKIRAYERKIKRDTVAKKGRSFIRTGPAASGVSSKQTPAAQATPSEESAMVQNAIEDEGPSPSSQPPKPTPIKKRGSRDARV